jgi:hypothetical protein
MSSAAVQNLVNDLDISGCGSLDLEVCPRPARPACLRFALRTFYRPCFCPIL